MKASISAVWALLLAVMAARAAPAQDDALVQRTRAATARFRDQEAAVREGYRPVGPDAPAMGRHWLNAALALDGNIDPARPPILSYASVQGRPTLVGVAFVRALAPGEGLPTEPGGHNWHVHGRTVAIEGVLSDHAHGPAAHDSGWRAAVLHVWTEVENPAGPYVPDNWALPYVRLGLAPPAHGPVDAARALALAAGPETASYYAQQFGVMDGLSPGEERTVAARAAARSPAVAAWLARRPAGTLTAADLEWLAGQWQALVAELRAAVPAMTGTAP